MPSQNYIIIIFPLVMLLTKREITVSKCLRVNSSMCIYNVRIRRNDLYFINYCKSCALYRNISRDNHWHCDCRNCIYMYKQREFSLELRHIIAINLIAKINRHTHTHTVYHQSLHWWRFNAQCGNFFLFFLQYCYITYYPGFGQICALDTIVCCLLKTTQHLDNMLSNNNNNNNHHESFNFGL